MRRKKGGGFWETVRTVFYAILVALFIRTLAYEPFNIPSGSMIPTLLVGDYLFVSKYSYGYSRHSFPFSFMPISERIFFREPQRGDVAVFKLPRDNKTDYIKRIVGLPGETLRMQNGRLFINGNLVDRMRVDNYFYRNTFNRQIRQAQYIETLPNGREHFLLEEGDNRRFDNTREFKVPAGHYFMMGDNRDHSVDSRSEVGFVPVENLVGRAEIIFFSTDGSGSFLKFWTWLSATRFSRLFSNIE